MKKNLKVRLMNRFSVLVIAGMAICLQGLIYCAGAGAGAGTRDAAGPPELGDAVKVHKNIFRIDDQFRCAPWLSDWDNDGDPDLLAGTSHGNILLCLNSGTSTEPQLEDGIQLQSGYTTIDVGWHASPVHIDWNADGKRDLLSGESGGHVLFFENTGADDNPVFASAVTLQAGGSSLDVGNEAHPFVVDWNNDGKDDLVVGASSGQVHLFINEGSQSTPVLGAGNPIQMGYSAIDVGHDAKAWVTDWNGDGKKDLIAGGTTKISLFENTGTDATPSFDAETVLYDQNSPIIIRSAPKWTFGDVNGDAKEDLFNASGYSYATYHPNKGTNSNRIYEECHYIPGTTPGSFYDKLKSPRIIDWDEDGRKDLVVNPTDAARDRHYVVFNTNTDATPEFGKHLLLTTTTGERVGFSQGYHSPEVTDWNNDGKKDLIVNRPDNGSSGDIYLYLNTGENYSPEFGDPQKLVSGYLDIGPQRTLGVTVTDWNQDGKKDMLVSSEKHVGLGKLSYVYLNVGTDASPEFAGGTALKYGPAGYEELIPGAWMSTPQVWDYEEDGDPDIVINSGIDQDKLKLYVNDGTPGSPHLTDQGYLEAGYGFVDLNSRFIFDIADWDENGKKDILAGVFHGMYYFPNNQSNMTSPQEISGFTVSSASDNTVSLTWSNPPDDDFAGVLIVRSESSISWKPSDRQRYHVIPGVEVSPGVTVVYNSDADHSATPWTDSGLSPAHTYYYKAFSYDEILPAYSLNGIEVSAFTSGDTPTPAPPTATPLPTDTPTPGPAGPPVYDQPLEIKREAFHIIWAGSPWPTDWDKDGKIDLLLGTAQGRIAFCRNIGAEESPKLDDQVWVQDAYGDLNPGYSTSPVHFDWNADGKRDLIIGYREGEVLYYENQGSDSSPLFETGIPLQAGYQTLDVGWYSEPFAVDWNNDGVHDLLVGDSEGYVSLFINVGTAQSPSLDAGIRLSNGYGTIDVGREAAPRVEDWNGDGKNDLVVLGDQMGSANNHLFLFENIGTNENPALGPEIVLYHPVGPVGFGNSAGFAFADMNNDSKRDLIQVQCMGAVLYYPNNGTNAERLYKIGEYIPGNDPTDFIWQLKVPRIVDWDEDGLKDIFMNVGLPDRHYVIFNTGTQTEPKFTKELKLTITAGGSYYCPEVTDWNNDGKKDVLTVTGDHYGPGDVLLFLNSGENYDSEFNAPIKLTADGEDLGPIRTCGVEVFDWNSDGKKDLLLGSEHYWQPHEQRYQYVYINQGTDAAPLFSSGTLLRHGTGYGYGTPIHGADPSNPHIWDYEEDGIFDVLMRTDESRDYVRKIANTGVPGAPQLEDEGFLEAVYGYVGSNGHFMHDIVDWDEDGKKDIIYGRSNGMFYFPNQQQKTTSPDEAIDFTVHGVSHHTVDLTWTNPPEVDFGGVLIVKSGSSITWRPSDRQHYHVVPGNRVSPGVEIVYKGTDDHSVTPWTDENVQQGSTQYYRAFTFDSVLPSYSINGAATEAEIPADTPTPTTTPTETPVPPTPTLTPEPSPPPIPAVNSFGAGLLTLLMVWALLSAGISRKKEKY